jgi:hypothetical protein
MAICLFSETLAKETGALGKKIVKAVDSFISKKA